MLVIPLYFTKSCNVTLKSNASVRSWKPIPIKACRPIKYYYFEINHISVSYQINTITFNLEYKITAGI